MLLVRLTAPRFGAAFAYRSAALLAIFPFAAVFSMAYAESLFLVLMLGAFLAAERGRAVPAGLLLALATLTRLQGVALIVPLAWILWEQAGRPRAIRPSWLALLLGPLAAVGAYAWVDLADRRCGLVRRRAGRLGAERPRRRPDRHAG